jgi:signal transduction histidine kinase/DNA-binding response OmpR family regulator
MNGQRFSENGNLLHNRWVSTLYYSGRDKLYIGTCDGLGCLDVKTMNFVSTYHKNRIFEGMIISVIYEDKHGYLWLGTSNGLIRYNEKTHASRIFTMHDGLPSDAICAIHDGHNNGLWISTDYGLSHYDTKTDKFVNFFSSDGLQNNEFSRCASFADCYGNLYFGGTDGVTYFNVKNLRYQTKKPDVKLVGLYINDKPVKAGMKSGMFTITKNAVSESSVFDFACDENNLTMEFSAMDFYNAERITYAYSINNGPWNVQRVGVNRVSFNNLSPGAYHFRIKSIDSDTPSDIKNITIVIHPAWYASGWAIFVYLMLLMTVLYMTYVYIKNRYRRQKEMMERRQTEEINEAKLQFFINISHEIRTPMSLIISPLQQLMSSDTDMMRQKTYSIINRNAQRILRLINQLMDIRKIDKGQMALRFSEHDVIGLIENICGDFEQQIGMKSIKFEFRHEMEKLNLWVDPNYFDKIIVNILSNAMKFTPDGGNITIDVRVTDKAEITISNTGSSIDEHEIEKIFGRFYQIRNSQNNSNIGTGIGLHLTRSLVELHHGDIHAENETDRMGCKFIIRLPLGNSHLRIDEMDVGTVQPTETVVEEMPTVFIDDDKRRRSTKHYILVVEDDEEIRKYICSQLRPEFNCKEGVNGKEAYQQILEQRPDLVISDVMMPEMDGFTLCKKIRLNTNVNTIPIVLLTAKTTIEDNLEGLDRGADAYITKPFNMNLLRKTVENLLSNREQLRNTYTGSQEQQDKITKLEAQSPDDKLMSRIMKVINANISNPDLNVEMITKEVGISRVHLYRKMKELTNQSMRDFIRNIRLKQAAILLSEKRYSVSEVVYMVGFSHISNFSTMFKNLYGMSPLEYREKMNSGNNESQD